MEKKSKKTILIGITSLFLVMILLLGLTYAYYRTRIIGNESNEPSISVVSKVLEIRYEDGTSEMNMEGLIEPGFTYEKTFRVRNTGEESVTYSIYLEDVINTFVNKSDIRFEITCTSSDGNECNGVEEISYPEVSTKLISNTIGYSTTGDVVQTYTVKINYPDTGNDQSDDMGATIAGKFNIYDESYVVDIEGTIATANDGDYVEINSVPKKSQIVNGKYKLTAVGIGSHTLYVKDKNGNVRGSASLNIVKGTQGINGTTVTINDESQTITINIKSISISLEIEITSVKKEFNNPYTEGTLAYQILNDNEVSVPKTIPGRQVSADGEALLASAEDDDGISYYFRGDVKNNYVNFSGMCWRIVRITGLDTVKLVLADRDNECNSDNYSVDNTDSAFIAPANLGFVYSFDPVGVESLYFEYSDAKNLIESWANAKVFSKSDVILDKEKNEYYSDYNFVGKTVDETNIVKINWCDDLTYSEYVEDEVHDYGDWTLAAEIKYSPYARLNNISNASPTFKCEGEGILKYNGLYGLLTADEVAYAGYTTNSKETTNSYLKINASAQAWYTLSHINVSYMKMKTGEEHYLNFGYGVGKYILEVQTYVGGWNSIRPSVVLKKDVLLSTNTTSTQVGTQENPYVID